jgi:hypothetical protein
MRTPATIPARYRPIPDVALVTNRPHRTIRTWAARGRIAKTYDGRGRLLVDLVAAARLSEQAGRRNRARAAQRPAYRDNR